MEPGPHEIRYPFSAPPEEGEAAEVAEGVVWIRLPLPMALDHVNVFALEDSGGWTLVDTGLSTRRNKAIWERILSGPLSGKPVSRVIATHHHPDHIGLAGWFKAEKGAELATTRTAWLMARMLTLDEQHAPAPETVVFWRAAGMPADILGQRLRERPFNFADTVAPLPLGFTRLTEGASLSAGGRMWTVRVGHGHAPEHATLWSDDGAIVLGGDQLLPSISPNLGVYATEPEADPVGEWLESCEGFLALATPDRLVLPGHKLPYRGLPARLRQMIENHLSALDRLRAYLDEPRTAVECFQPLFRRSVTDSEYGLALVEAMAHCLHLWHRGEVERRQREDGAWTWQRKG